MRQPALTAACGLAVVLVSAIAAAAPANAWDGPAFSAPGRRLVDEAAALTPLNDEFPEPLPSMTPVPLPGTPEEKPHAAKPADAEILLEEHDVAFEASGEAVETMHRVVHLRGSPEGWAVMRVGWEPWVEERPLVRARVISPDGTEHVFDTSTISDVAQAEDDDDDEVLGDRRVLRCVLPSVEKGAVLEESVVTRRRGLFAGVAPSFSMELPWAPTRRMRVQVRGTPGMSLAHRATGAFQAIVAGTNGKVPTLSLDFVPPRRTWRQEAWLPRELQGSDELLVAPKQAWQAVAASYGKIVDARIAAGDVKQKAAEWAGDAQEPKAVAARFLAAMRRSIRYTGLELGDAAVVPQPPAETLTRGFGDCKDMATLLVALLRARGIGAEVALLRPYGPDQAPAVPRAEGFTHAIVHLAAPVDLWLDPTQSDLRVGEPLGEEGSLALPAVATTKELVRIPDPPPGADREVRTRELVLADDGAGRMVETRDVWGNGAAGYRRASREDATQQRESYEHWIQRDSFAKALGKLVLPTADGDGPAHLEVEMLESRRGFTTPALASAYLDPSPLFGHVPPALLHPPVGATPRANHQPMQALRTQDLAVSPAVMELRYRVVPPAGYVLKTLPPALGAELPFVASRTATVEADGAVTVVFRLDLRTRRLDPAAVERVRKALDPLRDVVALEFENRAEKLFAAKDVRGALDVVKKDVAARPAAAGPRVRLARMLLRAGFGAAARAAALKAVELDPKSLAAQAALGWVLQHDTLGRPYVHDWNRAGAIAAYRAALAIDPKDIPTRGLLAELLLHDPDGGYLTPQASLDEAARELAVLKGQAATNTDLRIANVMFRTGRFGELLDMAPQLEKSAPVHVLLVAAAAARDGAGAAQAKAAELADEQTTVPMLLAGAALEAMKTRKPNLAADLFDAAAAGQPAPAEAESFIRVLRRAGAGPRTFPPGAPEAVVMQLFDVLCRDLDKGKVPTGLLAAKRGDATEGAEIAAVRATIRRQIGRGNATGNEGVVELIPAMLDFDVAGDAATGWRVGLRMPGAVRLGAMFVVTEAGHPVLYAADDEPPALAKRALEFADAGNGAAAGKWLDWLQETSDGAVRLRNLWRHGATDLALARRAARAVIAWKAPVAGDADFFLAEAAKAEGPAVRVLQFLASDALVTAKRFPEAFAIADALEKTMPDDAFIVRHNALRIQERFPERLALATERLAGNPADFMAAEVADQELRRAHRFDDYERLLGPTMEQSNAPGWLYNNLAWYELFRPTPRLADALANARRAVTMHRHAANLHTLAAVQAESGDGPNARATLLEAIDDHGGEPQGSDWYVLGRIAELYGLTEEAIAAYDRVPDRENPAPGSSGELAKARLARLKAAK